MTLALRKKIRENLLRFPGNLPIHIIYSERVKTGEKLYFFFLKKYGDSVQVNICPYKGTGDVYLAAGFFKECQNEISNQIFCVIGKSNQNISKLFGLKNVESVTQKQMDSLMCFAIFAGSETTHINVLHPDPLNGHTGVIDMFRNIKGLVFNDIIGYGAFNVENSNEIAKPNFDESNSTKEKIEKIFKEKKLKKGKTVLIAPYSYTLPNLPDWFWIKLTKELSALGFSVCTNLGNKTEKAIKGSAGIFLPYSQLKLFLEQAGYFIGIRSGFCEIISSIPCKKIVLYQPYIFWGEGENIDYFSLNKMGLCKDAIELQHSGIEFYDLIDEIKNQITKKEA